MASTSDPRDGSRQTAGIRRPRSDRISSIRSIGSDQISGFVHLDVRDRSYFWVDWRSGNHARHPRRSPPPKTTTRAPPRRRRLVFDSASAPTSSGALAMQHTERAPGSAEETTLNLAVDWVSRMDMTIARSSSRERPPPSHGLASSRGDPRTIVTSSGARATSETSRGRGWRLSRTDGRAYLPLLLSRPKDDALRGAGVRRTSRDQGECGRLVPARQRSDHGGAPRNISRTPRPRALFGERQDAPSNAHSSKRQATS